MFKNAIVRTPAKSLAEGITSANLGKPNYDNALIQHKAYIKALEECGVEVIALSAEEGYPDSVFVEDTAVLTKKCAVITNPGANTRKGEEKSIAQVLTKHYKELNYIQAPGTLEGGDVMMVGNHLYAGLSGRTNNEGIKQFVGILEKYGHTGSAIALEKVLHLKTGMAYLEDNTILLAGEFIDMPVFDSFKKIIISDNESYASNCIRVNGFVIVPAGFPDTLKKIQDAGFKTKVVDVSEFRKLDGGLSCLSLRF